MDSVKKDLVKRENTANLQINKASKVYAAERKEWESQSRYVRVKPNSVRTKAKVKAGRFAFSSRRRTSRFRLLLARNNIRTKVKVKA